MTITTMSITITITVNVNGYVIVTLLFLGTITKTIMSITMMTVTTMTITTMTVIMSMTAFSTESADKHTCSNLQINT